MTDNTATTETVQPTFIHEGDAELWAAITDPRNSSDWYEGMKDEDEFIAITAEDLLERYSNMLSYAHGCDAFGDADDIACILGNWFARRGLPEGVGAPGLTIGYVPEVGYTGGYDVQSSVTLGSTFFYVSSFEDTKRMTDDRMVSGPDAALAYARALNADFEGIVERARLVRDALAAVGA